MGTISIPAMKAGPNALKRLAAYLGWLGTAVWLSLLFRWMTFSSINWNPLTLELTLAMLPPILPYLIYGGLALLDFSVGWLLFKESLWGNRLGFLRGFAGVTVALA